MGLQRLKTLAFLPRCFEEGLGFDSEFLGPWSALNLTNFRDLAAISVPIHVFAAVDRLARRHGIAQPVKVLPRSLMALDIIVDLKNASHLLGDGVLGEAWWQPLVAALEFFEELASSCSTCFPNLQRVRYFWVGAGNLDAKCEGTVQECCAQHKRIQALSPDTD